MKPQIPDGYREATEDEFKCLPAGARCWGPYSKKWNDSHCVGEPGARFLPYIVPVTTAPSLAQEAQALVAGDPKGEAGKDKCPLWLIPPQPLEEAAFVHSLGAKKYGAWNWRQNKVCASTYISAIMRHLNAWREGEDLDPESGRSHLAHIVAGCFILMDAALFGNLIDDRAKKL